MSSLKEVGLGWGWDGDGVRGRNGKEVNDMLRLVGGSTQSLFLHHSLPRPLLSLQHQRPSPRVASRRVRGS